LYLTDGQVAAVLACQHEAHTARLIEAMRGGLSRAEALAIIEAVDSLKEKQQ
jgi:hypothetical protein